MRGISIISGLQIAVVILGWCALAIVLKFNGYPTNADPTIRWSPLAMGLREYGFWLLLVTPVWMAIASAFVRRAERAVLKAVTFTLGGILAFAILTAFLIAIVAPYTRLFLIKPVNVIASGDQSSWQNDKESR